MPIGSHDIRVTSDKSVHVSCVHVCMTEPVRVYISSESSSEPPALRWLLVYILLYPFNRPLTEGMSVGACCQPAGMPIKFVLALGPL